MKTVMSSVLIVLAILLIGLLSVQNISAAIPDAIDLGNINKENLDRCLLAIATDPNMLLKIDQKQNFNSDKVYYDTLYKTIDSARKFIPYDLSIPANFNYVNEPANLTASLCLVDGRIYFWNTFYDRDIIGWVSIITPRQLSKTKEPKVTVWIIPRLNKTSPFIKNWSEYARQKNVTSIKALMKLALAVDLVDVNNIGEQVRCQVTADRMNYSAKIFTSQNVLQAEIMLGSGERISQSGKYVIQGIWPEEGGILKRQPAFLPFWPPKTEDSGTKSP